VGFSLRAISFRSDGDSYNPALRAMPEYPMELLNQAIDRAQHLVSELEARKAEAEANPPPIPPEKLEMGRMAMDKALASARRMLVSLQEAWEIAVKDMARADESDEGEDINETEDESDS
jgi:hypothetical protein